MVNYDTLWTNSFIEYCSEILQPVLSFYSVTCFCSLVYSVKFSSSKVHYIYSMCIRDLTYSSVLFILAATFRRLMRVFFAVTSWDQNREKASGVKDESDLPIPDEPRKRNTRGCSSSYQPFSFLLMATQYRDRERQKRKLLFSHLHLMPLQASFTQLNRVDLRVAGIPETMIKEWECRDEKRVRDIWLKKGRKKREKTEQGSEMRDLQKATHDAPAHPPSQWGH